mmetsp:Transcript_27591/g.79388  ORF Transcript_27591/g.79388 Transcript_27591/m.79388 type:complete len:145 (+) Transcript_27591:3-437(+)
MPQCHRSCVRLSLTHPPTYPFRDAHTDTHTHTYILTDTSCTRMATEVRPFSTHQLRTGADKTNKTDNGSKKTYQPQSHSHRVHLIKQTNSRQERTPTKHTLIERLTWDMGAVIRTQTQMRWMSHTHCNLSIDRHTNRAQQRITD